MKTRAVISGVGIFLIFFLALAGSAVGQAIKTQYICDFGGSYTQATVKNAQTGFFGLDIFAGKMLTSSFCLGLGAGYDVVSLRKIDDNNERFAVIPVALKAKYFFNFGTSMQAFVMAGAGVYRSVPHLVTHPIGEIWFSSNQPGGSIGLGLDYWFLITSGVGFAFEYHFFNTDGDELFSYFAARIDYCLIKF